MLDPLTLGIDAIEGDLLAADGTPLGRIDALGLDLAAGTVRLRVGAADLARISIQLSTATTAAAWSSTARTIATTSCCPPGCSKPSSELASAWR